MKQKYNCLTLPTTVAHLPKPDRVRVKTHYMHMPKSSGWIFNPYCDLLGYIFKHVITIVIYSIIELFLQNNKIIKFKLTKFLIILRMVYMGIFHGSLVYDHH